jgi:hypothetical protein
MEENTKNAQNDINNYYQNYKIDSTNSYIDHNVIYAILVSNIKNEEKLNLLNNFIKPETAFDSLKGWNKSFVIDEIVRPIIANKSPEEIMAFKSDINNLREASKKTFVKTEKGDIKYVESKFSTEEYIKFISDNRESIKNGVKNADSVSTAMLLLAYKETSKAKFYDILTSSGVSEENATNFIKSDVFSHNADTNQIKKLVRNEINADNFNVMTFKKATNFLPSIDKTNDNEQNRGMKF